jgi:hypothetical protein
MDGLFVRPRGVEVDVLDDLGFDHIGIQRGNGLGAEIDLDHTPACVRRRQRLHGVADPAAGGLGKIEVAIDAIDDALATERGEPLIDLLADRTESA